MKYKLLEEQDLELMEDVLKDDNMIFNKDFLNSFINDNNAYGFIAKENNNIVGFAYAYTLLRPDGKTMFYLHSIGMLPTYQNNGYGTKLMTFVRDYAKKLGCSEMFLITNKSNKSACKCYENAGGVSEAIDDVVYVYDFNDVK